MILSAIAAKLKQRSKADFKGRHYEASLIVQAISWYLRYPLSYRDIEKLLLARGLEVDHGTLNHWVLAYSFEIKSPNTSLQGGWSGSWRTGARRSRATTCTTRGAARPRRHWRPSSRRCVTGADRLGRNDGGRRSTFGHQANFRFPRRAEVARPPTNDCL
ncbi:hypothetical protein CFIICLFH_1845 [Methylobacterium goesingense]|uniref:Transposase n=1 Tax=Methylobacterium goesingense TaxID=243690 RepID=A0ABV2LBT6_9HYPH|nr:hypothetical protein CFIICLFH_1845 [Methylobacterium goesingense]